MFYFTFGETISISKIIGIVFLVPCAVLLSLDGKESAQIDPEDEAESKSLYSVLAVICAISAPLFWTIKAYFTRLVINSKEFPIWDFSIDVMLGAGLNSMIWFPVYLALSGFKWSEFICGQFSGLLLTIGTLCAMNAL